MDAVFIESVDKVPVVEVGLNVPVTPEGRPVTWKETDPANPDIRVMVTV